jgi:hypothetical protein
MKKVLLGIGLPVVLFGFVKFASAATLTLTPASGSYTSGQTISVNINLDTTGAAIDGVDVYSLHFNAAVLQVQDASASTSGVQITAGSLLPQTLTNTANNSTGVVQFSQVTTGGTTYTGAGVLATINFTALANGTSPVTFDFTLGSTSDTNVAGGGTDKLTSVGNASFTVTGSQSTAPTVNISANPTSITSGSISTLNWSSSNATSCAAIWRLERKSSYIRIAVSISDLYFYLYSDLHWNRGIG